MSPREANVLLTKAALIDARLRREPEERAQMAVAWADVLGDVPIEHALAAVDAHYRVETRTVMPADIVAAIPAPGSVSEAGNVTEQRLAAERRAVAS